MGAGNKTRRRYVVARLLQGALALCLPSLARAQPGKPVRVAAASDLKFVLSLLLARFQSETGQPVQASFGSSGSFARQIQQGLPVDLFMSADEALVFQLADAGLTRQVRADGAAPGAERGALYAVGRIALYLPRSSSIVLDSGLKGLQAQWPEVRKFAIANPEHAPYGRAAREALQQLGLWEMVLPKLVLGENISQATQFVATGAAQAGITALSLALAPEVAQSGRHIALPASLHAPLRQRMVLLQSATPAAVALYAYLQSEAAREIFGRYGFSGG
jgi:molybdate transport system substrate-binding protein